MTISERDAAGLRLAIALARQARGHGNHPFGALLVDADGQTLLAAENSVVTGRDPTGHAELNLIRGAGWKIPPAVLKTSTLYTSGEPCPMCAGAIVWGNVRRVVYGLGMEGLYAAIGPGDGDVPGLRLGSRAVFESAPYPIEVVGPALEDEARAVHDGFWTAP